MKVSGDRDSKQAKPMAALSTQPARPVHPAAPVPPAPPAPPVRDPARRAIDAELIGRCLAGERAAARVLHAQYYPIAAAFLRKLGTRPDDIEDAAQEVFMQFFRYLSSFRGDAELKTWLYRLCMTEARRARRRRRLSAALAVLLMREDRRQVTPPSTCGDATMVKLVGRALDRMSEGHRLVFVLFEMEGLPGKQVAEIAGCPEATVWRRLHDARRLFRETLGLAAASGGNVT
jgi:RNA polymerase sigma-70 factor (ECF subfamily)